LTNSRILVDKQAGALYFEVTRSGKKDFLGIVDMQIDCTILGFEVLKEFCSVRKELVDEKIA
jgi:hypothetical protein